MSEELLQTIPQQIGKYTYYRLGSTTLNQLKDAGLIPKKDYEKLKANKPDGLVVYHGQVRAVVEYKQPRTLKSDTDIDKAIKQEIGVAKALCKLLIITDSTKSFWVNPHNGERIKTANGKELKAVFHPFVIKHAGGGTRNDSRVHHRVTRLGAVDSDSGFAWACPGSPQEGPARRP